MASACPPHSTHCIADQDSWKLEAKGITAYVTRTGWQLAPVNLDFGPLPLSVNPWAEEKTDPQLLPLVKALRGDFFCAPFGLNLNPWKNEKHPVHGEPTNVDWTAESLAPIPHGIELKASVKTTVRPMRIAKTIRLLDNHPAVYSRHVISDVEGPMCYGHHAMLLFPPGENTGMVATSPFEFGQVYPGDFESAKDGGYYSLKPGARFKSLREVPDRFGGVANLSSYPAREGYDDLVMLFSAPGRKFAWSAVTFPSLGLVWFSLKDPSVLRGTVMWHSNGGRHYPPWNGRHKRVLGLEEITGHFHSGLRESAEPNQLSAAGIPTVHNFVCGEKLTVNYIMAAAKVGQDFGRVADIQLQEGGVVVRSENAQSVKVTLDTDFVHSA